jgi:hypothetical protein
MWLLTASIVLFFIVIAMIVYANWPSTDSRCRGSCPPPPHCNRCGVPKPRCRCPVANQGCSFC